MAEKRFSSASYIDIPAENYYTTADDPNKLGFIQRGGLYRDGKGFTGYAPVIYEGKFSGKQKLYINGIAAEGLINDKFYRGGDELTKEQIQKLPVQTISAVAGELAALGLRTPTGRGDVEGTEAFVRDAAAETKFYADFRKVMARTSKQAKPAPANAATTGGFGGPGGITGFVKGSKEYYDYWANASDEAIFRLTGGVNKEGRPASAFGINDLLPPGESKYVDGEYTVVSKGGGTPFGSVFGAGRTGGTDDTGGTGNNNTDGAATKALLEFEQSQATAALQEKRQSAYDALKKEFTKYGIGSLVDSVKNLILTGSSPEEMVLKLRETPEYLKRFAGNKLRLDAGLNVYDEATYLDLENAYDQIFTSYGVEEAAGNTRAARQAKYAEFIGGTKSPDEIKGRVQLAVLASQEDAVTKATMKELYPMLTDKDLVSYFLNPKETLPKLETKIRAAQVGAAAVRQGLVTNVATAEELVGLGVTEEEAEKAYSAYAYDKPRIDLLSGLDPTKDNQVNQQVAEGALLKNLASEQRKLDLLKQKELGRFGGSAGAARNLSLNRELGGTY
jgi:hypothetical protein